MWTTVAAPASTLCPKVVLHSLPCMMALQSSCLRDNMPGWGLVEEIHVMHLLLSSDILPCRQNIHKLLLARPEHKALLTGLMCSQ